MTELAAQTKRAILFCCPFLRILAVTLSGRCRSRNTQKRKNIASTWRGLATRHARGADRPDSGDKQVVCVLTKRKHGERGRRSRTSSASARLPRPVLSLHLVAMHPAATQPSGIGACDTRVAAASSQCGVIASQKKTLCWFFIVDFHQTNFSLQR